MNFDDIELMSNIFNKNGFKSNHDNEKLIKLFKSMDYESLIKDFEGSLSTFPSKKKYPHYATIFYLALTSISLDNIKDLANVLSGKRSYKYLISGLKMLVSGKSKTLYYDIKLADKSFQNKYQYINRFAHQLPYWQNSSLIFLFKVIYFIDRNDFFTLLEQDKSNFLFLIFFSDIENVKCNDERLIKFLNSDDEMKSNGALCYLMADFHRDYRRYLNNKNSEEIEECLNKTCKKIFEILNKVEKRKKVKLILNYITVESVYPSEFINMITQVEERKILIEYIALLKLNGIDDLISLEILLESNCNELNNYILKFLMNSLYKFIKNDRGIYENSKFKRFISKIKKEELIKLNDFIQETMDELRISDFDKQVRYVQFNREKGHYEKLKEYKEIIMECIGKK